MWHNYGCYQIKTQSLLLTVPAGKPELLNKNSDFLFVMNKQISDQKTYYTDTLHNAVTIDGLSLISTLISTMSDPLKS